MGMISSAVTSELAGKYKLENETLSRDIVPSKHQKIQIEFGDAKEPARFMPQTKIIFHDNETNLSIRALDEDDETPTIEINGEEIQYKKKGWAFAQYEKPDAGEFGGIEQEWIFDSKPEKIQATIRSKGLKFFKQLPLNQEITPGPGETITETTHYGADGNIIRHKEEEHINSWVIYFKDKRGDHTALKGKNYGTGQAGIIKRIKAIDANGDWVWGDLNILEGGEEENVLMDVVVPEEWLDNAAYPIRVDPTLGLTSQGAGYQNLGGNNSFRGSKITATEDGYVGAIGACVAKVSTGTVNLKFVILNSDKSVAGSTPGEDIYYYTATLNQSDFGYEFRPLVPPVSITNTSDYYIGGIADNTVFIRYNTVTDAGWSDPTNSYTTPADASDGSLISEQHTIIAYYTTTADTTILHHKKCYLYRSKSGVNAASATATLSELLGVSVADYTAELSAAYPYIQTGTTTDAWHQTYKVGYHFDTSVLSGYYPSAVGFCVFPYQIYTSAGTASDGDVHVIDYNPDYPDTPNVNDWANFGSTSWGEVTNAAVVDDSENIVSLDANAVSNINTSGYSYFGLVPEPFIDSSGTWASYTTAGMALRSWPLYKTSPFFCYLLVTAVDTPPEEIKDTYAIGAIYNIVTKALSVLGNIITTYYSGATYDWKPSYEEGKNRGYQGD